MQLLPIWGAGERGGGRGPGSAGPGRRRYVAHVTPEGDYIHLFFKRTGSEGCGAGPVWGLG